MIAEPKKRADNKQQEGIDHVPWMTKVTKPDQAMLCDSLETWPRSGLNAKTLARDLVQGKNGANRI